MAGICRLEALLSRNHIPSLRNPKEKIENIDGRLTWYTTRLYYVKKMKTHVIAQGGLGPTTVKN